MFFQEYLPAAPLRPFVHQYAELREDRHFPQPVQEKVPPSPGKGLIFYYRRNFPVNARNGIFQGDMPSGFILPAGTRSNTWTHRGGFSIFSIIFKPGMFRFFFPFPLQEYLDIMLLLEETGDKELMIFHELVLEAKSTAERIAVADAFLLRRLSGITPRNDIILETLRLLHTDLHLKICDLSKKYRVSSRHLRRLFLREVGIYPKPYQKIIRACAALNQINTGRFSKLSDVAYSCGYYDQTHFIESFKEFTGLTPKEYQKANNAISQSIHWREEVVEGKEIRVG